MLKRYGLLILVTGLQLLWGEQASFAQGVYPAWVARYNGPGNGPDEVTALALDNDGCIYLTGKSAGTSASGNDYATVKFSADGVTLWVRRYDGPGHGWDAAYDLGLDDSGHVYVTGESTPFGYSLYDLATIKYSLSGESLWTKSYAGPYDQEANALVMGDSGEVYVTGLNVEQPYDHDYLTIKYSPQGESLWIRTYQGTGGGNDIATDIELDQSGNVFVTGYSPGMGTNNDYVTIKYSPVGESLWIRRYNSPDNVSDLAWAIAVDDSRDIYVTGNSATIKYGSAGDSLWARTDIQGTSLLTDHSNNLYVTGSKGTFKCTGDGTLLWTGPYGGRGLALNSAGNVYVTGGTLDIETVKYSPSGDILWIKSYDGPGHENDQGERVKVDQKGNVYVAGSSWDAASGIDYTAIKYSPCAAIPGDVNASGQITLGDIIHLVNYIFDKDRPPCLGTDPGNCWIPLPLCRGDINASGNINLGDIIHLVNFIFDKDRYPCLGLDPGNCWTPPPNGACCLPVP